MNLWENYTKHLIIISIVISHSASQDFQLKSIASDAFQWYNFKIDWYTHSQEKKKNKEHDQHTFETISHVHFIIIRWNLATKNSKNVNGNILNLTFVQCAQCIQPPSSSSSSCDRIVSESSCIHNEAKLKCQTFIERNPFTFTLSRVSIIL